MSHDPPQVKNVFDKCVCCTFWWYINLVLYQEEGAQERKNINSKRERSRKMEATVVDKVEKLER